MRWANVYYSAMTLWKSMRQFGIDWDWSSCIPCRQQLIKQVLWYLYVGTIFIIKAVILWGARDSIDFFRFEPEEPDFWIVLIQEGEKIRHLDFCALLIIYKSRQIVTKKALSFDENVLWLMVAGGGVSIRACTTKYAYWCDWL